MTRARKAWTPSNWASLIPFGIGRQHPNNYNEVFRAIAENRDALPYAWRILKEGVCDGCALGTTGMRDWTLDGIHLCNIRLRLLRLNTLPALDIKTLEDVSKLDGVSNMHLRALGRLPVPLSRRQGEPGFTRISWDDALERIARRIGQSQPERTSFYLTSRGIPNETYYAAQKAARAIGTNNIDNAARVCHAPSTTALKAGLGVGATTCSYTDWLKSDLIVFIGSNVANNQPVAMKYLHFAKKNGAKVAVLNTYREPGMENYWIPSNLESALFGTKIADRFFLINTGSDTAFLNGAMKHLVDEKEYDENFVTAHTTGFAELASTLQAQSWEELEAFCGTGRDEMQAFARMVADAERAVFVWSMGITQHQHGVENVHAIINLALLKGFVGRDGCGLMPIRGHSGVQGGAEMGAYSTVFPGGIPITRQSAGVLGRDWGFAVPDAPGMTAPESIDAAAEGRLDVLFCVGGNFVEVLPDPEYVDRAMRNIPLRVHFDIVLSKQMFRESGEEVILLPAMTRYEVPGGVTQTSTERRIMYSPEIEGPRIDEARPEWEVFLELARRVRPELSAPLSFETIQALREEIARIVPFYDGIQNFDKAGDQFQYGGAHLCADWTFETPDGKAHFAGGALNIAAWVEDTFRVSTRRGKQFNTMVHEARDAMTGAARDAVFMCADDAMALGLREGEPIVLRNAHGAYRGKVFLAAMKPRNLQVHWPEGNVLLDPRRRSDAAGIPDYNADVVVEKGAG